MTVKLILCDYPPGKKFSDNVNSVKVPDSANAMGAVKTLQALLSSVVKLKADLPGFLTLKKNVGTQPFSE